MPQINNPGIGGVVPGPLTLPTGDLEIATVGNGIILPSADGTRYRVTVANGGALTTAALGSTYIRPGGAFHYFRPTGFTYLRP